MARDDRRRLYREVRPRMAITPFSPSTGRRPPRPVPSMAPRRIGPAAAAPRRLASNFVALSAAEIACRAASFAVMLTLARRLSRPGYGRIEFAFSVVFWLVLLVRDGLEVFAAREIARHPRLIRPLVNHILAVKLMLATGLLAGLALVVRCTFSAPDDRAVMTLYGLMLLTTAMGLDFVYRGMERVGLVAFSLLVRTTIYAAGVALWVTDAARIAWVPAWLVLGEAVGIGIVWACYARRFGLPRPKLGGRFLRAFFRRGRQVSLIQISQAVIGTADLLVVGLMSTEADVGLYGMPLRIATAVLTFGLIFQQVVFPALARSWRDSPAAGRRVMDALVRVLVLGLVPLAVGATVLSGSLVRYLLPADYAGASLLLALSIWRAPLLTLAFLYQTALIALNRESAGVRLLLAGGIGSGPLVALMVRAFGLPGAAAAVVLIGLALVVAGHWCLAQERRQPAWHHHLAHPLGASLAMVPACLLLVRVHVLLAIAGGAVVYFAALAALGGLRREDLRTILGRG